MAKISPLMIAPPLVFAGFVALAAFGMFRPDPEGLPSTLVGQMAPALSIIGVNFKDTVGPATSYLTNDGNPFEGVAFDPQGRTAINWGVTAPPETFIIAGDGTVLFRYAGPLVGSDYEQRFLPALQDALKN